MTCTCPPRPRQAEFSKVVAFPMLAPRGATLLEETHETDPHYQVLLVAPTKLARMLHALQSWSLDHDFAIFLNRDVFQVVQLLHNAQVLTLAGVHLSESSVLPVWACSVASSSGDVMLFDLRTDKEVT